MEFSDNGDFSNFQSIWSLVIWSPIICSPVIWSRTLGPQTLGPHTWSLDTLSPICSEKLNIKSPKTDNLPFCQEILPGLANYSPSCLFFLKFSQLLCPMCDTLCAAQLFLLHLACMSPVNELSYQAGSVFLRAPTIWQFHFIIFFRML